MNLAYWTMKLKDRILKNPLSDVPTLARSVAEEWRDARNRELNGGEYEEENLFSEIAEHVGGLNKPRKRSKSRLSAKHTVYEFGIKCYPFKAVDNMYHNSRKDDPKRFEVYRWYEHPVTGKKTKFKRHKDHPVMFFNRISAAHTQARKLNEKHGHIAERDRQHYEKYPEELTQCRQ